MTIAEFKRIGRLLKQVYAELEKEALAQGIDVTSDDYTRLTNLAREKVLASQGFTLEEYKVAKMQSEDIRIEKQQAGIASKVAEIAQRVIGVEQRDIPTPEQMDAIARKAAEEVVKPPVIEQRIVKEIVVEKPTIVKETVVQTINEEYNDGPLAAEVGYLRNLVENLPPAADPFDPEPTATKLRNEFTQQIDVLKEVLKDMPDFRKLGMGLQAQIDTKIEGVNVNRIIYSATEPTDPRVGDIWISA